MKTQIERFTLLIAALAISRTVIAQQAEAIEPEGRTYELSVVMADVGDFRDCMTFRADHSLQLQADNGLAINWLPVAADRTGARFHAVTSAANPYGLALHGVFGSSGAISGDAVNDRGLTFTFTGRLNPDCALRPEHTAGGAHPPLGSAGPYGAAPSSPRVYEPTEKSVASRVYGMRIYGGDGRDDCYIFSINGVLVRNWVANLIWAMDGLNEVEGTFQAVGSSVYGTTGTAIFGQRMPWGELRVHGLESTSGVLRPFVGSGREADACIAE